MNKYLALPLMCLALLTPLQVAAKVTGADFYKEVLQGTPIYDDPALDSYIRKLGEEVVAQSEMAGEKFIFTLLDSPDLNAFATRDNYVYVNRGLLNYVSNEAQLVSVLAHEVGHITRKHVTGQEGKATGAQILSTVAAILSGSGEVYEAGMAYANSLIRGYGRRNELEADEAGAEYMAKLGYAPSEMISMLSMMKDYELLQKDRARAKGASKQTYHGIFSSHPRNDSRLRTVVNKAKTFQAAQPRGDGAATYRQLTEGLIWGENFLAKESKPQRYSDMTLRVRFDYPEGWKQTNDSKTRSSIGTSVSAASAESAAAPVTESAAASPVESPKGKVATGKSDGSPDNTPDGTLGNKLKTGEAKLAMVPIARTSQSPEEYLYNHLKISKLEQGSAIAPAGLKGFSGILPGSGDKPDSRIAVIYYKLNAYIFTGEVTRAELFPAADKLFKQSIATFRPISRREIEGQKPKRIHYVKATNATTFDKLGKALQLSTSEIDDLRIINGHYPSGEPKAGDWIKIFKQ
ncbi:M48 family metalloprotease [Porticoccaceae bacterium]|nr:M48 family metalloprotease [Porticoccaceae bacterium]